MRVDETIDGWWLRDIGGQCLMLRPDNGDSGYGKQATVGMMQALLRHFQEPVETSMVAARILDATLVVGTPAGLRALMATPSVNQRAMDQAMTWTAGARASARVTSWIATGETNTAADLEIALQCAVPRLADRARRHPGGRARSFPLDVEDLRILRNALDACGLDRPSGMAFISRDWAALDRYWTAMVDLLDLGTTGANPRIADVIEKRLQRYAQRENAGPSYPSMIP